MSNRRGSRATAKSGTRTAHSQVKIPQASRSTSSVLTALPSKMTPASSEDDTASLGPAQAESATRQASLVVLSGPCEGEIFGLKPDQSYIIGRAETCDLRVSDDGISRVHARVRLIGDERAELEDLNSRNGTFVGEEKIKRHDLCPEEIVRIGATTILKFCFLDPIEEQYRRRMMAAALRDPLTSVYNRRHFEERLASECAAARRHRRPLCLLLIDVDDFKRINDRCGHLTGDAVLRGVAQTLNETLRREDLLFRYGGEEFAILVRETDMDGATKLAERLRKRVSQMRYRAREARAVDMKVTVSIGLASFNPEMHEDDLVDQADAGLYQAKRDGKDRCIALK